MSLNLYFAGNGLNDEKRKNNCNQLLSQLNERKAIMDWVEYKRTHPECSSKLLIDSGAFTAHTKGKEVDVDDYINFINPIMDAVDIFAQVDKIPGRWGQPKTEQQKKEAPKQSWDNYLYMSARVTDRDKLMPIYHQGEDWSWLRNMLEYRHTDGSPIKYIGLGGVAETKTNDDRRNWFKECYKVIKSSSNPDVQVHAFGMTSTDLLSEFPFTSADSTTWLKAATYGELIVINRDGCACRVKISERTASKQGAFHSLPNSIKDVVKEECKKFNMTVEELETEAEKRLLFNMLSMNDYMNNKYVCKYDANSINSNSEKEVSLFDF